MKKLFTILILIVSVNSNAQVICGTTDENGSITLTAPPDNAFTSIEFASYATPNDACGSFTLGACHAANSEIICEAIVVGQNSEAQQTEYLVILAEAHLNGFIFKQYIHLHCL